MPKVQINYAPKHEVLAKQADATASGMEFTAQGGDKDTPITYDEVAPELFLRWRNSTVGDGHVQFVAEVDVSHLRTLLDETGGAARVEVWFPALRRSDINIAVHSLRAARDKAMGADA